MFERQLRLNYLPEMKQFQMQLFQLSRLLKDNIPELHELFDKNEVATTLYASSWMLTIFSSSFEIGFVAKVYDLLLSSSNEVIFRVILSLLQVHKDELLKLDCFEDIMNYLKNVIPKIETATMAKVFEHFYTLDITRQLMDYEIEYNVLKEEIFNTDHHVENLKLEKEENKTLKRQLQMAESNIERLENIRHTQQQETQAMQIQIQSLETTIQTLGDYLTSLSIHRTDIDIPSDIRRLLQQLEYQHNQQRQQQMKRRPIFLDRKIGKSVSVNNLGMMNLKVLVEQNELDHTLQTPPSAVTPTTPPSAVTPTTPPSAVTPTTPETPSSAQPPKKKYFEKAFEQIKQHQTVKSNSRILSRNSPERARFVEHAAIDEDVEPESPMVISDHPLSSCSEVNFQFNTMQLKSIETAKNLGK